MEEIPLYIRIPATTSSTHKTNVNVARFESVNPSENRIKFDKPTDYFLKTNATVRHCTWIGARQLRVSNITGPQPEKKVFKAWSDAEVQKWFDTASRQVQDQFRIHDLVQLADDLIKMKRAQSWQKELLPEMMVKGPVCTQGYNKLGQDFVNNPSLNPAIKAKQHPDLWKKACANWDLQLNAANRTLQSTGTWLAHRSAG